MAKHKDHPESLSLGDYELVQQAIESLAVEHAKTQPAPTPPTSTNEEEESGPGSRKVIDPVPAYAKDAPAETKLEIEYLVDLTLKKGILQALQEAKKSSPFVFDAFRDSLAGEVLLPILRERGIL